VAINKKVYWIIAIIVVFGLGVLWLIGGIASSLKTEREYDQLRQIQLTQEKLEKLVAESQSQDESLENLKNENLITYEISDIFITDDASKLTFVNYGQEIHQLLSLYLKPRENEVKVMLRVLENQSQNEIKLITASRKTAEQALVSLLYMDVPKDMADLHLQLTNDLNQLIFLLTNMEKILTKPTIALKSAAVYNPALIKLFNSIIELDNYFFDHDIVLKDKIKVDFTTYFND
jgi:septal ring factor EnvC (AmiA/AmiB activator)